MKKIIQDKKLISGSSDFNEVEVKEKNMESSRGFP
jgi:hypothetical protein